MVQISFSPHSLTLSPFFQFLPRNFRSLFSFSSPTDVTPLFSRVSTDLLIMQILKIQGGCWIQRNERDFWDREYREMTVRLFFDREFIWGF